MSKKQKQLYIGLGALIFCAVFFAIFFSADKKNVEVSLPSPEMVGSEKTQAPVPKKPKESENKQTTKVVENSIGKNYPSATVHAGNVVIDLEFTPNATFYDTL